MKVLTMKLLPLPLALLVGLVAGNSYAAFADPPTDSPGDHIFDFTKPGSKIPPNVTDTPETAAATQPTTVPTGPVPPTPAPIPTSKPATEVPASASPAKLLPPTPATLADSIKLVNEVYAADIAKATTAEQKKALSTKMQQAGTEETVDMPGKFAVLQRATEIATDASDMESAFTAIDETAKTFQINAEKEKTDTAAAIAKSPRTDHKKFATAAMAVADRADAAEQFGLAKYYSDLAEASARQSRDAQLIADISARSKQIAEIQDENEKLKQATAVLKLKPADPDANLKVGEFHCFFRGDWENGLPFLARCSDTAIAAAATLELKAGTDAAAALPVADHWWAIAEKETGNAKLQIRVHAAPWYRKASPAVSGLAKTRADKRATESHAAAVQLAAESVTIDPIQLINTAGIPEAHEILHSLLTDNPDVFHKTGKAELIVVHDGLAFPHGKHAQRFPGSKSPMATVGNGQPWLWGIYQDYPPGDYVFVYRLRAMASGGGEAMFLDVCSGGNTVNGTHPVDTELATDEWVNFPVPVSLNETKNIEIRLWTRKSIACDRVYVFKIE